MLFNSIDYLLFFPIVFTVHFALPRRARYLWLLFASYFFYMRWDAAYALLMLASTGITFASGLLVSRFQARGKAGLSKLAVGVCFFINLSILVYFKYANFIIDNINALFGSGGAHILPVTALLPVGISFYTFQALGYTVDVYRGKVRAERNVLRYALFVSFFPQLVAGPIERSENLLGQIREPRGFSVEGARRGLLLIAWGLFLKMVLADTLAGLVEPVYANYAQHAGIEIILATVCFAIQIYCDFAGYSTIAMGSAALLGFRLMENFKSPYLATSVSEFWRRWHISLTSWFTDYLYIPLGGNRKGKARTYFNTLLVFLVSGLWHGANWSFVVWGLLNGLLIVLGDATRGFRARLLSALRIDSEGADRLPPRRALTFSMVCVTWVFFRAQSLGEAVSILRHTALNLQIHRFFDPGLLGAAVTPQTAVVLVCGIAALFLVDSRKYCEANVGEWVLGQRAWVRWPVYVALFAAVMFFGVYGLPAARTQFLYFQF